MYAACVLIGPAILRSMYVEQLRTTDEIARHFGCSGTTVLRHLRRFQIPVRRSGPCIERSRSRNGSVAREWSAELAYVVGLIATDGNLGRRRPVITIVSKDADLLETVRRCFGLTTPMRKHRGGYGHDCSHLRWQDRALYEWFCEIGLSPAKSLTLGPLAVPDRYFADFFRGCIDGDGSVLVYTDRYHVAKCERYIYERLLRGSIRMRQRPGTNPLWKLRYAKAESIRLLRWMYYASDVPCLGRKRARAEKFLCPLGYTATGRTGRPRVGWLYNGAQHK